VTVTLAGEPVELSPEDLQLRVRGQQGFAVSREGSEVVALDLTLDESLRKRGLARDVVRLVQDLRKTSGLDVADRIRLHVAGLDAIADHFGFIAQEVLAVEVLNGPGAGAGTRLDLDEAEIDGPVEVWLEKVDLPR
jgi:isoleucyl-tRNA synthetase